MGYPTPDVLVSGIDSISPADVYPLTVVKNAHSSHVLLLKANKIQLHYNDLQGIEFDAQLIDVATRKIIWTGQPYLPYQGEYNLNSQKVAGDILNALKKDGLIRLPNEVAINLSGEPIKKFYYSSETEKK